MSIIRKSILLIVVIALLASIGSVGALACASIYVGSGLTDDGSTYFARSEDMSNSTEKQFYVIEAGAHAEGEEYHGCYGYVYTFTHDSYGYTAFRDNNGEGVDYVCPDCGSTEEGHVPYEEAGTNEYGLSVSATETIFPNSAIEEADPLEDAGISESEVVTVLLSECKTAREAVEYLCGIYDDAGANDANGLFIGDQSEVWYIENTTGHQYIALLLSDDLVFIEPNMSVIGMIDLDDTDNIIASEGLIETAVEAGTFVGDADENVIDFRASYSVAIENSAEFEGYGSAVNERMINGVNYLNGNDALTEETITDTDFCISNIDADGNIVSLYTNINIEEPVTLEDVVNYFHVSPVGRPSNQETHIFQIDADAETELGTVEWVSMANDIYSVFVPCYPMLINDTYEGYHVSTAGVTFTEEQPADGSDYYPYEQHDWRTDESTEGYRVLPSDWRESSYWAYDAVANYILYADSTEEDETFALETYAALQQDIYDQFAALQDEMTGLSGDALRELLTSSAADLAQQAHETALAVYDHITADGSAS